MGKLMNFWDAVNALFQGKKVARPCWNKAMWIAGGKLTTGPLTTAENKVLTRWLNAQTDTCSTGWLVVA